jgi:hypothetical protein
MSLELALKENTETMQKLIEVWNKLTITGLAEVTQMLKTVVATALRKRDKTLAPDQQESLDMILHKIGRIVNGDPDYDDSWVDIAGYAKLVADRLQGVER